MDEYRAVYKCRLCGEEYTGTRTMDVIIALQSTAALCNEEYFYPKGSGIGVHRYDCHYCKDGSYGLADFQGLRKGTEK